MLIYARFVMIILLISSIFGLMGSMYSLSTGDMFTGTFGFLWSAFWAWIAWTSWNEMSMCARLVR